MAANAASPISMIASEDPIDWNETLVITRQCLHDDWGCILAALRQKLHIRCSINPFQTDKAILFCYKKEDFSSLILNRDWLAVGNFSLKFEKWNHSLHASSSLIPSYGGWVKLRNLPIDWWSQANFEMLGNSLGGFIRSSLITNRKLDCMEVVIKVKENYCGFIPAGIIVKGPDDRRAHVQIVSFYESHLLMTRKSHIHGGFSMVAAANFFGGRGGLCLADQWRLTNEGSYPVVSLCSEKDNYLSDSSSPSKQNINPAPFLSVPLNSNEPAPDRPCKDKKILGRKAQTWIPAKPKPTENPPQEKPFSQACYQLKLKKNCEGDTAGLHAASSSHVAIQEENIFYLADREQNTNVQAEKNIELEDQDRMDIVVELEKDPDFLCGSSEEDEAVGNLSQDSSVSVLQKETQIADIEDHSNKFRYNSPPKMPGVPFSYGGNLNYEDELDVLKTPPFKLHSLDRGETDNENQILIEEILGSEETKSYLVHWRLLVEHLQRKGVVVSPIEVRRFVQRSEENNSDSLEVHHTTSIPGPITEC